MTKAAPPDDPALAAEALLRHWSGVDSPEIPLGAAALAFATLERPGRDPARYQVHLAEIARQVGLAAGADPTLERRVAALRRVLVEQFGYQGDVVQYDDLANADLMQVIDRRRGLPVTLGIIYIEIARAQGWPAFGLAFPNHFLIRLDAGSERAILDPFDGGRSLDPASLRALLLRTSGEQAKLEPAFYKTVDDRDVILRLQNNIKLRLLQAGRALEALAVIDRLLMLLPRHGGLWRECGLVNHHLGRLTAAMAAIEQALSHATNAADRHQAAVLLQQVKAQIN